MASTTKQRPQPDHLAELFHDLRATHKGGPQPPRAIWLPVVLLLTLAGLGILAWGAYLGGTHLLGLNEESDASAPAPTPTLVDLGPAPALGVVASWANGEGYLPAAEVTVLQVWTDMACPGCNAHARLLNASHRGTDGAFNPLWIFSTADPGADFVSAAALARDAGADWAVGWDPTGRLADAFPGDAAVATYIIDQEGRLQYAVDGAPQDVQLSRLVRELTGTGPDTNGTNPPTG